MIYETYIEAKRQQLHELGEIFLRIKVHPKASSTEIYNLLGEDTLKVHVKETPERGKANKALAKYLGKLFNVPSSQVTLISGHTDAIKLIKIQL